ncbi:unnamed protein product [Pylaiella littoralis]
MVAASKGRRSTASCALLLTCSCLRQLYSRNNPTALALQPSPAVIPVVSRGSGRAVGSPGGVQRNFDSYGGVKRSRCGVQAQHRNTRTSTSLCSMINNIFDTRARSQLVDRTYASDPSLFQDIDTLSKCSSWTDPVIFSDQMALSPTTRGAIISGAMRSLLVAAGFLAFPSLVDDISPIIFLKDGALTDEVRLGLTGSFLPGVSLLFGALFSYTISLLVNRQIRIEEVVNAEVSALSALVLHLEDYFRYSPVELEASMEAAWRHTDTLIFQSRYQEILLLVQDDPLEDLMRLVITVDDEDLASDAHRNKSGVHRESLGYLRGMSSELIKLRTLRLSFEGRVLPPVHFGILIILASMLLFGFTLASAQTPTSEGPVKAAFESQVLFTLLLFSFSLLLEFAFDLTNPFVGRYKLRRTTTTAVMVKIRSEIVGVMGQQRMKDFDKAFGRQKRRTLRDFQRETGMALPADNQL